MKRILSALLLAALLLGLAPLSWAGEITTSLDDRRALEVTIYNEDLALVKDLRRVRLPSGVSRLALGDVSARMHPQTALLEVREGGGEISIHEQFFDFDLLTPRNLLKNHVGRQVQWVRTHPQTGAETVEAATLLAYGDEGMVLQVGERIETQIPGRLVFTELPAGLRERPTLVAVLENSWAGTYDLELSYLTGGMSWRADYAARLDHAGERLALSSWATLTNQSGTSFDEVRVHLVAGEVGRVPEDLRPQPELMVRAAMAAPADKMAAESFFDYQLYRLPRLTSLADRQTKQVALFSTAAVPVRKEYVLRGADYYYSGRFADLGERLPVAVLLEFVNREQDGLGLPLPQGILRVYQEDGEGGTRFIGENRLAHTPRNEKVRLQLGNAFDLSATRKQTDFRRIAGGERQAPVVETAYELRLRNGGKQAVEVRIEEPLPGDWEILSETLPHRKEAAHLAVWEVRVPAEGEARLEYRALVRD
ncbi:DUF4139 domain-containing protein [Geoalkalibacter halelectricus]|uniref:DUF4139 domain-containing protein n=1 Tax=Geoalkalibacter halelectricus TaxID=2847045 RepID=A0ABY5ZLZ8_9BACT|nr:DUF4139 domain-containing protein [Geoalkalibacter halelectricus]MDO3378526.1 DUF4139 domain-containing protein [Geoalkalibacter halelectricus]UWZ80160.1 DUF4139 domain-containing protein [Geoalkalibacter halelectricus]